MQKGRIRIGLAGLLLALVAFAAIAGGPGAVRKQVEASMLVTGTIDIAHDGSVAGYVLDKPEMLPESVVTLASKALPQWRFKPVLVDGKSVLGRARMSLRYVANREDDGTYRVRIRSAWFGDKSAKPGEAVASKSMRPPEYPFAALRAGIGGTAYVVVRVGRDGKVADVVVERVNLRTVGSEHYMQRARKLFADASARATRRWSFSVPEAGPQADQPYWDVRVPVAYYVNDQKPPAYGQWDAYVPGPEHPVPWIPADQAGGNDALVAGGIYPIGGGPKLITQLDADAG